MGRIILYIKCALFIAATIFVGVPCLVHVLFFSALGYYNLYGTG